jgi:hypothetical protein
MNPEVWLVGGIIAAALAYLAWTVWRTVAGTKKGCGSGCGKCAAPAPTANGRISLPQV